MSDCLFDPVPEVTLTVAFVALIDTWSTVRSTRSASLKASSTAASQSRPCALMVASRAEEKSFVQVWPASLSRAADSRSSTAEATRLLALELLGGVARCGAARGQRQGQQAEGEG